MERRTKILAGIVVGVAALLLADKVLLVPYLVKWRDVSARIDKVDLDVQRARAIVAREKDVREGWAKVRGLLDKPRVPDVQTHFVTHLGEVTRAAGVTFDIKGVREQQQGDFKEYVFETQLKLKWEQLGELLVALHNSREFLKPARVTVGSQYEKEERLDVDLKVSTIEYAPAKK